MSGPVQGILQTACALASADTEGGRMKGCPAGFKLRQGIERRLKLLTFARRICVRSSAKCPETQLVAVHTSSAFSPATGEQASSAAITVSNLPIPSHFLDLA